MPPVLKSFAERVYEAVTPLTNEEANNGYDLANYCGAAGEMFQVVEDYGRDGPNGEPGWSILLDIDRAPSEALGYLGQFVGVSLLAGLTDVQQRQRIRETGGWQRGTKAALIGAAKPTLTGGQSVLVRERFNPNLPGVDSAYSVMVITYTAQTPNPAATLAALGLQKPGGIMLYHAVITGQDFQALRDNNFDFQAIKVKYATFQGVRDDTPGL